MYELIYKKKSENKIKSFIKSYKNIFLNTFTDTGLFYEDIIRENYINNSEKFYNEIIDSIDWIFTQEQILWYSILENHNLQIVKIVWNYRLFIEYSENLDKRMRFIEDIKFNKK